jgi:hypothetical protein
VGRFLLNTQLRVSSADTRTTFSARLDGGANAGHDPPSQYNFLLGGRETVPGHHYREFESTSFALARTELARTVASPWIRARVLGNAAYLHGGPRIEDDIILKHGDRIRASAGVGVGLLWDAIRVDVLKGRDWQTLISVRHEFWDML